MVDSSRYFVIKVVDRASRNHAFIGIGFRDRLDASDFSAALDDYRSVIDSTALLPYMLLLFLSVPVTLEEQENGTNIR